MLFFLFSSVKCLFIHGFVRICCMSTCDLAFMTNTNVWCVCAQGRLQDGQRAEERGQQEVCLQQRPTPQLPQTVPASRRQLQIDTLTLYFHSVQIFIVKISVLSSEVRVV